jgi:hypothetical protein
MLGMAVGAMQAIVGHQAAVDDYHAKSEQWRQNIVNAQSAARDEQGQLLLRHMQEEEATNQKVKLSQIEEAEQRALVEVTAGHSGVSGLSIQNLLSDVTRRSAYNRTVELQNFKMTAAQLQAEQNQTVTTMESRIASIPRPVAPNPAVPFVQMLAAGANAFGG